MQHMLIWVNGRLIKRPRSSNRSINLQRSAPAGSVAGAPAAAVSNINFDEEKSFFEAVRRGGW